MYSAADLRSKVKDIITYIMLKEPLIGLMLKRTWIVATKDGKKASTDGLYIYVNPDEFFSMKPAHQAYVLAHEVLHMVLQHPDRVYHMMERLMGRRLVARGGEDEDDAEEKLKKLLNIIADAVVNTQLDHSQLKTDIDGVRCSDLQMSLRIPAEVCKKESFENIVEMLLRSGKGRMSDEDVSSVGVMVVDGDVLPAKGEGGGEGERGEASVLNEGDSDDAGIRNLPDAKDRIKEKLSRKFFESLMVSKSIGRLPAFADRLVNEIMKPKVDWRQLMRKHLAGSNVKRTWSRPSRKHPEFPAKELTKRARTVVLVDTSGSIGEVELRRFASEIYGMLRDKSEVVVVPWDAVAYPEIRLDRPSDINKLRLTGGGGTMLLPALKVLDARYRTYDNIVIFSDWYIGDITDSEVQNLLRKYSRNIIAVTTSAQPPIFLKSIMIEP